MDGAPGGWVNGDLTSMSLRARRGATDDDCLDNETGDDSERDQKVRVPFRGRSCAGKSKRKGDKKRLSSPSPVSCPPSLSA